MKSKPPPPASPAARLDQAATRERAGLVKSGLAKLAKDEPLAAPERRAIRQWEREQLDRWGPQFTAAVPKKLYCEAVGIQQKVALEQSRRFDLEYHTAGKTVDLFAQLAAWHRWASDNRHLITRLIAARQVAALLDDETESLEFWQTELVKEKTLKERDAREQRQRETLPRQALHELLLLIVDSLARLGQAYQRKETISGEDAALLLSDRLAELAELIDTTMREADEYEATADPTADDGDRPTEHDPPPRSAG